MSTLPRENLYRASYPACEYRDGDETTPSMLTGHFAVFDQWTTIRSKWEGTFMERLAPGAFSKTIAENRDAMRVLLNHGKDSQISDKPIAKIETLREDATGAYYEASLFEGLDPLVVSGLKAGAYGASFRFKVMRDEFDEKAKVSTYNPDGIPERTIREAQVMEFGPVTFPAYAGATAGVRSITDLIHDIDAVTIATPILLDDERLEHARAFISRSIPMDTPSEADDTISSDAPPVPDAEPSEAHLGRGRRVTPHTKRVPLYGVDKEEPGWLL